MTLCDLLGLKHTTEMGLAKVVASTAAATSAEAILISVLGDPKLPEKERKGKVKSCLDTVSAHSKSFGEDVKGQILPGIYEKAVSALLEP